MAARYVHVSREMKRETVPDSKILDLLSLFTIHLQISLQEQNSIYDLRPHFLLRPSCSFFLFFFLLFFFFFFLFRQLERYPPILSASAVITRDFECEKRKTREMAR